MARERVGETAARMSALPPKPDIVGSRTLRTQNADSRRVMKASFTSALTRSWLVIVIRHQLEFPFPIFWTGRWREKPKLPQDINHRKLYAVATLNFVEVPGEQVKRDTRLDAALLIGALTAGPRTIPAGTTGFLAR